MGEFFSVKKLSAGYDRKPVLRGISFEVRSGEAVTLIGPNGAGKSTLLKTAGGLLSPLEGGIFLHGKELRDYSETELSRHISVLLTERPRTEWMTCEEAVSMGRYPYTGRFGVLSENDREKIREAMELVNVAELKERDFDQVSDGQRQRVMLARAICQEPELLIMDEPATFLDIRYELELLGIIKKLTKEKGLAVLMSMHELNLARAVSDRLMCVKDGKVLKEGSPEEIFTENGIRELFGIEGGDHFGELLSSPGS